MRHYVLIRAVYGPDWTPQANARRLAITSGITVPSLAAQGGGFTLAVAIHPNDPLLAERRSAFEAAGVPVTFLPITPDVTGVSQVAIAAYQAPWSEVIGARDDQIATTRLDDDDAFTPDAFTRLRRAIARTTRRTALVFPFGVRVYNGRCTLVRHDSNAMHTLVTPPGEGMNVYDYRHRKVRQHAAVRFIDTRIAWLWVRHPDSISGWRIAKSLIPVEIREAFPIDWSLVGEPSARGKAGGWRFK